MFPTASAAIKRAKNPTGVAAYIPFADPENGINHPFTELNVLVYEEPIIDSLHTQFTLQELEENELKRKEGQKVDEVKKTKKDDSSLYLTTKGYRYIAYGTRGLTPAQRDVIDKIERGEMPTEKEILGTADFKGLAKRQSILSPLKPIYKGTTDQVLLKMAAFLLLPSETSRKDAQGNYTIARPGRNFAHNLRIAMEDYENVNNTIIAAGPESMSKQKTIVPIPLSDIETDGFTIDKADLMELDPRHLRLQQETPTNKTRIIMPRQSKGTITSEQNPNATYIKEDGTEGKISQVIKDYHKNIDNRANLKHLIKRNLLFTLSEAMDEVHKSLDTGKINPTLYNMLEYARAGLKASKAKTQMLEFFEIDKNTGAPKWELNNTITVRDFESYFLSFINQEGFSETQPGHNGILASSAHMPVVKEVIQVDENGFPIHWRVLREDEQVALLENNPNWIDENVKSKSEFDYDNPQGVKLTEKDYYIDRLRHDMIYWKKDDNDNWFDSKERISEIMMPAHFMNIHGKLKPGKFISEIIAKQVLIRIPTQDKQMMASAMIVDFPASVLGSSVYAPDELIEIAGWDFDVDKVFQSIGEWYYDSRKEEYITYGSREGKEGFYDYIRYMVRELDRSDSLISLALAKWNSLESTIPVKQKIIKTSKEIYREWVNWINEELTITFEDEAIGTGKTRLDVYKETNYDPDKSRLKFANANQYYYNTTTKEFEPQKEHLIIITENSTDKQIEKFIKSDQSISLKGALTQAVLPITFSMYTKYVDKNNHQPYEGVLNNE